ncbi:MULTISPECIES: alpha/beta fold hydrolase [Rhizobium]|uniref:alpha/beta fold hydrolase n=1 Tax=Rhizobium TaxID=379 RepID=UPI0013F44983|nr:alpha/beta hydrolase [Rhizobium leguminosarum]UFW80409.1 alpha/beta hydrolase [Rhizobium leguminosarum bv. viciae]
MTTIVTIPGIMSDARTWRSIAGDLKSDKTKVFEANRRRDATIEDMASRTLSETDGALIVLAHSMGARVAMEMGRQSPGRIRAMVLSNANAEGPAQDEAASRENRIAEAKADVVVYARRWVTKVISAKSAQDPRLVGDIRQMVEDCPPDVHERQNRSLVARPDATAYLSAFDFPVLLMTGAEDHLSTPIVQETIAELLRDCETVVIEDAGHLLPFEQPRVVSAVVKDFLLRRNF